MPGLGLLWVRVLKPIVMVWAGLKVLDEVSLAMRVVRLASAVLPFTGSGSEDMCDLCDDVVGDLLAQEGLSAVPCSLVCLKLPSCVKMCERVKEVSHTSTKYPCVAAGYCDDALDISAYAEADLDCQVGRFFSCHPRKYCRRTFLKSELKFSCRLRPGIGRWVGLTNAVSTHAGAVGAALLSQPFCSEPHAGPYCIARPKGFGAVCEGLGSLLSIVWGGYQSIVAIESPGGDDDTQWLTFWLILGIVLSVERFFMRPILSNLSMYYEAKLVLMIWLLYFQGAEHLYRVVRRFLMKRKLLINPEVHAQRELSILEETGKALIQKRLKDIKSNLRTEKLKRRSSMDASAARTIQKLSGMDASATNHKRRLTTIDSNTNVDSTIGDELGDYQPDYGTGTTEQVHPSEKIQKLCDYLLSTEGSQDMTLHRLSIEERAKLLEVASYHVQFQPKYLYVRLVGTVEGPEGALPAMDSNGLADPYVTCRLVPSTITDDSSLGNGSLTTRMRSSRDKQDTSSTTTPIMRRASRVTRRTSLSASMPSTAVVTSWKRMTAESVVTSSTLYRTIRPQWNELLELPLSAGYIDESGQYRNDTVQSTSLNLQVWDADVEFWGIILRFSHSVIAVLVIAAIVGYVMAITDHLTDSQILLVRGVYGIVAMVLIISYVMAVIRKADDDPVGQCTIPLKILLEKKGEHRLRLILRELNTETKPPSADFEAKDDSVDVDEHPVNSVGGLGVLRVRLMLSEN